MAYLNTRYGGNLGVLWVDAHPDVLTPKDFAQGNAQVLGALLGKGDCDLVSEVDTPLKASRVMYAGLDAWTPVEGAVINTLGLRRAGSDSLAETSAPVLNWIADEGVAHPAIHFDVDVLDPTKFGPVLFNKPDAPAEPGPMSRVGECRLTMSFGFCRMWLRPATSWASRSPNTCLGKR
jgi:arginase